jgi:hypothetical protein
VIIYIIQNRDTKSYLGPRGKWVTSWQAAEIFTSLSKARERRSKKRVDNCGLKMEIVPFTLHEGNHI